MDPVSFFSASGMFHRLAMLLPTTSATPTFDSRFSRITNCVIRQK